MELTLTRTHRCPRYTLGTLRIEGHPFRQCETLEPHCIDWERERKIPGQTAIPEGRYRIRFQWSSHFGREMPYLEDVPRFTGIMLHAGNTVADTRGCILVGLSPLDDPAAPRLQYSASTFSLLWNTLQDASRRGEELWITVL